MDSIVHAKGIKSNRQAYEPNHFYAIKEPADVPPWLDTALYLVTVSESCNVQSYSLSSANFDQTSGRKSENMHILRRNPLEVDTAVLSCFAAICLNDQASTASTEAWS